MTTELAFLANLVISVCVSAIHQPPGTGSQGFEVTLPKDRLLRPVRRLKTRRQTIHPGSFSLTAYRPGVHGVPSQFLQDSENLLGEETTVHSLAILKRVLLCQALPASLRYATSSMYGINFACLEPQRVFPAIATLQIPLCKAGHAQCSHNKKIITCVLYYEHFKQFLLVPSHCCLRSVRL